jgi:hypothetical protein
VPSAPQHRPHRASIESLECERKRDEFIAARGNALELEAFEDRDVVLQDGLVGGEVLGVLEVHAGRVDADGDDASRGKGVDERDGEGGEVAVPVGEIREGAAPDEDSLLADGVDAADDVAGLDAGAAFHVRINDAAGTEVVRQWLLLNGACPGPIVVGSVGVGPKVDGGPEG